jgi:hypothetical protein
MFAACQDKSRCKFRVKDFSLLKKDSDYLFIISNHRRRGTAIVFARYVLALVRAEGER